MPGTRASTKQTDSPTCHVLNYFYDSDHGFAMTALVHTLRFHIIVDYARLECSEVQREYVGLLDQLRAKYGDATGQTSCKKRKRGAESPAADSGYSSRSGSPKSKPKTRSTSQKSVTLADDDREDDEAVRDLQNWILAPFGDIFAERAPASEEEKVKTVHDWFHGPVSYWTLTCPPSGTLEPVEEESSEPLESHIAELTPKLNLPKYITSHSIPIFTTSDLSIVATSDSPSPRHPAVVKSHAIAETYFLKLVDPAQPGPLKRELKLLKEIEAKGLHEKIRVPRVLGVVVDSATSESRQPATGADHTTAILGFLLTPIPDASPLTTTLDLDVAEGRREQWAEEIEKTVKVLHDHGIVWGDAKADNFMVDKDEELWIIDFGGSYTEGWVDQELNETIEGDDQGMEKIVGAVRDPEGGREEEDADDDEPSAERHQR